MRPALFLLPAFVVLFGSCGHSEETLVGKWQGVGISENSVPLDVDPSEIHFEFFKNGLYAFQSTLAYKEAGKFKIEGDLLYTLDTINGASSEKAVKLMMLSKDSLCLLMQSEGNERLLKMTRED